MKMWSRSLFKNFEVFFTALIFVWKTPNFLFSIYLKQNFFLRARFN